MLNFITFLDVLSNKCYMMFVSDAFVCINITNLTNCQNISMNRNKSISSVISWFIVFSNQFDNEHCKLTSIEYIIMYLLNYSDRVFEITLAGKNMFFFIVLLL